MTRKFFTQLPINNRGYIALSLIVFALLAAFFLFPRKFLTYEEAAASSRYYCRDVIRDENTAKVTVPAAGGGASTTYHLIKENVPVFKDRYNINGDSEHSALGPEVQSAETQKRYRVFYPAGYQGKSYPFPKEDGSTGYVEFAAQGIIELLILKDSGQPDTITISGTDEYYLIDIYQADGKSIPDDIFNCVDVGSSGEIANKVIVPNQSVSDSKKQLQLEWFIFNKSKFVPKAWWTPECKPAIYLYPPEKTLVNVKVAPKGFLTYTDPLYDSQKGWDVWADREGKLSLLNNDPRNKTYDYLYYESKIKDEEINKPAAGFVVKFEELDDLYKKILPQLGLNPKEQKDFIEYWDKALPKANYYFVGIVDKDNIDKIEPLSISPKPDLINRVRLYFEALDNPKQVDPPSFADLKTVKADNSFYVSEWGGLVKNDKNHPFTCSQ